MSLVLNVEILGEFRKLTTATQGAQSTLQGLQDKVGGFATNINRIVGALGITLGFHALIQGAKDSVAAASDLEQQFGALDSVFKGNSSEMKIFSKEMNEIGLSSADAARQSVLLGSMLKGAGFSLEDTTEKTQDLVKLAGDLAATFGGKTSDAVAAISSLLRGERDPIERYGVSIKQVDINAEMAAQSMAGLTFASQKEAEQQAALTLLYEKTVDAQGQAARESDTYAAKVAELEAKMKDASVEIGQALLPMLQKLGDFFIDAIPDIEHFFSLLNESLDDPQVKASVSRMDDSLSRLGDSIGALFGSTEEDEAQGFVNFWTVLSALVTEVADKVNLIVASMAALTGNTKPIEEIIRPYIMQGVGALGYDILPSIPDSMGRSEQGRGPVTVNNNIQVKTDATAQEIANAINRANRATGTNLIRVR